MYTRILVPLEHSDYDDAVVAHVRELATLCSASIVLIHVADGWAALRATIRTRLAPSREALGARSGAGAGDGEGAPQCTLPS